MPEIKWKVILARAKNRPGGYFRAVLLESTRSKFWILLKLPVNPTSLFLLRSLPRLVTFKGFDYDPWSFYPGLCTHTHTHRIEKNHEALLPFTRYKALYVLACPISFSKRAGYDPLMNVVTSEERPQFEKH